MRNVKKAKILENKCCSTCAISTACLLEGPLPDFEIIGLASLYGLTN